MCVFCFIFRTKAGEKVEKRNLFQKIFGKKEIIVQNGKPYELLSTTNYTFTPYSGRIFDSDIVRAALRPKANAVGKLNAKHIRGEGADLRINPDANLRMILERPNPYMSMQDFLMKMTYQREINHNAFAYVDRDDYGRPVAVYPIPYSLIELLEIKGEVWVRFQFWTGKRMAVSYTDLIHLRKDFAENDFFGESGAKPLKNPMEVIGYTDQSIVAAVKSSAVIKWIMKFKSILQPEDVKKQIAEFKKNYLSIENEGGAASSDPRYDLEQVKNESYVPNAAQMKEGTQRLYGYFGVNNAIVQNNYTEDEWNAFFESEIEPIALQLSNAFTQAFFSAREKGFGNKIIFESSSLQYASMSSKLALVQMVDRGALTPNEWRLVLNLPPIEGGDKPLRRLDTAVVSDKGKEENTNEPNTEPAESENGEGM